MTIQQLARRATRDEVVRDGVCWLEVLLSLRVPADNERGPIHMEQALAAIHQANHERHPLSLEIAKRDGSVGLFVRVPDVWHAVIRAQVQAQYPDAQIVRVEETKEGKAQSAAWWTALRLAPEVFPMRRYGQFDEVTTGLSADPISPLLNAVEHAHAGPFQARIAIKFRPASRTRVRRAERSLHRLARFGHGYSPRWRRLFVYWSCSTARSLRFLGWLLAWIVRGTRSHAAEAGLHTSSTRQHDREADLQSAADKLARPLYEIRVHIVVTGPAEARTEARRRLKELAGAFGHFGSHQLATFHTYRVRRGRAPRRWRTDMSSLLSTEELATVFHPPKAGVRPPTLSRVASRELPPPTDLPLAAQSPDLAVLGVTAFRGRQQRFGMRLEDRLRHTAIIGKTGMGKTTLLQGLIASDIAAGHGVSLLDPHGDLAEAVLASIPSARTNDVIFFDAGDAEHPIGFNPLACDDPSKRPLVASGVLAAFKKLFGLSWGPRMEHILRNVLLTLLEVPCSTLVTALRVMGDARFRQSVLSHVADAVVRSFWLHEFAAMPPKLQAEAIAPVQNKLGHFVASPLLRNIIGQERNRLDLRTIMDEGRVLVVNLSKGRLGDDASSLLGSLLVSSLQLEAMGRADLPEAERRPFHLYVDEFQNFATDSFATILSEARKYRLALTVANQYLAQMDDATRAAVFGNVGTLVSFQVGADDAEAVATQLGAGTNPADLLQLPKYTACVRLLIDGMPSRPFTMKTLPVPARPNAVRRAEVIRAAARRRHARPKAAVEAEIARQFAHA